MDAIILAGGLGRRLKNIISEVPKPMALINNKPFLDYVLDYLETNKIRKVILSVCYKSEIIKAHYGTNYNKIKIVYSEDKELLGTGGAIKEALVQSKRKNIFVINGDTYFDVNLKLLLKEHYDRKNDITVSLKPMRNFKRYGFVQTELDGSIRSFEEKKFQKYGFIDGGIYLINSDIFIDYTGDNHFLFTDFIRENLNSLKIGSASFDELFIDMGTPKSYKMAQKLFKGGILNDCYKNSI